MPLILEARAVRPRNGAGWCAQVKLDGLSVFLRGGFASREEALAAARTELRRVQNLAWQEEGHEGEGGEPPLGRRAATPPRQ